MSLDQGVLGLPVPYPDHYSPQILTPIARAAGRKDAVWLYHGGDLWTCYEVSWLDAQKHPQVAVLRMDVDVHSPNLVESKSLKLYLNSLNQTVFTHQNQVLATIAQDLQQVLGMPPIVQLLQPHHWSSLLAQQPAGVCLDAETMTEIPAAPDVNCLRLATVSYAEAVEQRYYTDLFRSCCPVTGQPDWASVYVEWVGRPLQPSSLLSYLVSFRQHAGFHEQCVERIFMDLLTVTNAQDLKVMANFTRRGGIDISPYRFLRAATERPQRSIRQ